MWRPPFPVRWRLYVLLNRFGKHFPLVLKLKWRIVKRHVFPFVVLSDLDELFAVLTESQRSVGANYMAFVTRCAIGVTYRNRDTRKPVLVPNEGRGGIVACLIVGTSSDGCGYGRRLRRHHLGEAIHYMHTVRDPHAAAVVAASVLWTAPGVTPILRHIADCGD